MGLLLTDWFVVFFLQTTRFHRIHVCPSHAFCSY